ncbi:hypothetical protein SBA3_40010 [Candidatus Sulfopaludibacter sp. SbA3]|nr:hypothetical protein SBA3_40010 [Candidatus Sulfopaludibacter sp. SbA3]
MPSPDSKTHHAGGVRQSSPLHPHLRFKMSVSYFNAYGGQRCGAGVVCGSLRSPYRRQDRRRYQRSSVALAI